MNKPDEQDIRKQVIGIGDYEYDVSQTPEFDTETAMIKPLIINRRDKEKIIKRIQKTPNKATAKDKELNDRD